MNSSPTNREMRPFGGRMLMRSARQQGLSRRAEDGCELTSLSRLAPTWRSNDRRGGVVPPTLYHHSVPEGILFHERWPPCLPSSANGFSRITLIPPRAHNGCRS